MIAVFGFFLMVLAVLGGGLIAKDIWFGFVLAGLAGTSMGTFIAFLQREREFVFDREFEGELTIGRIRDELVSDDTLIFVQTTAGILPAIGSFECHYDGKHVVVVETPYPYPVEEQAYYGIPERDAEEDFI